jgi:hypothetical protein
MTNGHPMNRLDDLLPWNCSQQAESRNAAMLRGYLYEAANVLLTRVAKWSALKAWGYAAAKRCGLLVEFVVGPSQQEIAQRLHPQSFVAQYEGGRSDSM